MTNISLSHTTPHHKKRDNTTYPREIHPWPQQTLSLTLALTQNTKGTRPLPKAPQKSQLHTLSHTHSVSKELTYRQSGLSMVSGKPRSFTDSGPKYATGVIPTRDMGHLASPYSLTSTRTHCCRWQHTTERTLAAVTVLLSCSSNSCAYLLCSR